VVLGIVVTVCAAVLFRLVSSSKQSSAVTAKDIFPLVIGDSRRPNSVASTDEARNDLRDDSLKHIKTVIDTKLAEARQNLDTILTEVQAAVDSKLLRADARLRVAEDSLLERSRALRTVTGKLVLKNNESCNLEQMNIAIRDGAWDVLAEEWILGSDACQYYFHQFGSTCEDRKWDVFKDVKILFLGDSLVQIEAHALMEIISGDRHLGAYPRDQRTKLSSQGCEDNLTGNSRKGQSKKDFLHCWQAAIWNEYSPEEACEASYHDTVGSFVQLPHTIAIKCSKCDECPKMHTLGYDGLVEHYSASKAAFVVVGGSALHNHMNPGCWRSSIFQLLNWTSHYKSNGQPLPTAGLFLIFNPVNPPAAHKASFAGEAHAAEQSALAVLQYNVNAWQWLSQDSGAADVFDRVLINPLYNITAEANRLGEVEWGTGLRSLDGTHPVGTVNHQIVQADLNIMYSLLT